MSNKSGLSNNAQAVVVFVSSALIAVGAISVPAGLNPYVGLGLMVCGAVGLALKEKAGSSQ